MDQVERSLKSTKRNRNPSLYVLVPVLDTSKSAITMSAARQLANDMPDGRYMVVTVRDEFTKMTETVSKFHRV
jgi:hypothetical protein